MFARTIARSAVRLPSRRLAMAKRGMATSSNASRSATSNTASIATSIVALAAGGVVIGSMLGDSKKMYLEGASKRQGYSERMISREKGEKSSKSNESTKQGKSVEEEKVEEAQTIDMEDLSEDASQQSAFDPETNTINWDCPCLGGMAQGPCGEEFKEAFSCFVFSEEEVKGVDCIDKFKAMQDCFRKYPEHYKEELEDEEEFEKSEQEREATQQDSQSSSDDDEGVREWKAEMEKEGKK